MMASSATSADAAIRTDMVISPCGSISLILRRNRGRVPADPTRSLVAPANRSLSEHGEIGPIVGGPLSRVLSEASGREGDPCNGIRTTLRCGQKNVTDRHKARPDKAIRAMTVTRSSSRPGRQPSDCAHPTGPRISARAGSSPRRSRVPVQSGPGDRPTRTNSQTMALSHLAYCHTARSSNGGLESINGLIELHRRIARGFRNGENYRPRMLLIGSGSNTPTASKQVRGEPTQAAACVGLEPLTRTVWSREPEKCCIHTAPTDSMDVTT